VVLGRVRSGNSKAGRIRLAYPRRPPLMFWLPSQLLRCCLPSSVNTPPYPVLLVLFAMFLCLPERGGAIVHVGTWPLEGLLAISTPFPSTFTFCGANEVKLRRLLGEGSRSRFVGTGRAGRGIGRAVRESNDTRQSRS